MSWLSRWLWPVIEDEHFGPLRYWFGKWHGRLLLQGMSETIPLTVNGTRNSDVRRTLGRVRMFVDDFGAYRKDTAAEFYDLYALYRREDVESGNFTEQQYSELARVTGPENVWDALDPVEVEYWPESSLIVTIDVRWPNSHQLFAGIALTDTSWEHDVIDVGG